MTLNGELRLFSVICHMLTQILREAAEAGAVQLRQYFNNPNLKTAVKSGGINDLVTEADHASDKAIIEVIRKHFPDHFILSEETGNAPTGSSYKWIIDPIDGTINFAQGIPICCVSIGIEHKGEMIMGAVDWAAVNLEGVLIFDGGDNQNWTISNMEIFDFDLSLGFFNGAGGSDAFNGTTITNNRFRIPGDLNTTVAPADANQNIGIHYSFGTNQTISGNTFTMDGTGISAGANRSTSIAMQSNTSGGTAYDGLKIINNTVTVTGNPDPTDAAVIRGFWENGSNTDADIEISGRHSSRK